MPRLADAARASSAAASTRRVGGDERALALDLHLVGPDGENMRGELPQARANAPASRRCRCSPTHRALP
jgi:hypothetical protein